jgi:hypothetical protein
LRVTTTDMFLSMLRKVATFAAIALGAGAVASWFLVDQADTPHSAAREPASVSPEIHSAEPRPVNSESSSLTADRGVTLGPSRVPPTFDDQRARADEASSLESRLAHETVGVLSTMPGNDASGEVSALADGSEWLDHSVVGRPFPVSASIWNTCDIQLPSCDIFVNALADFKDEARDIQWGNSSEEKLRRVLVELPQWPTTIRALECRADLCFFEVESKVDQYFWPRLRERRRMLEPGLYTGWLWHGHETDPADGARITVTLGFFSRDPRGWLSYDQKDSD